MTIHIELNGRLANNIFQFMMGEALSSRGHDVFYIASTPQHKDFIRLFNLRETLPLYSCVTYEERHMGYNNNIFNILEEMTRKCEDIILRGYWQNFDYILGIECQVKDKIRSKLIIDVSYKVDNVIHVRGTDYKGWGLFDICKYDYYKKAYTLANIKHGVVVTDDNDYAIEVLGDLYNNHTVTAYNVNEFFSLSLLAQAKKVIIPNSSFSMIGSWLGEAEVYAPSPWFNPKFCSDKELNIHPYHNRCKLISI